MLVFTDGSFSKKPNVGGAGFVILHDDCEIQGGKYLINCKDNNIAEIFAIYSAIIFLEKHNFTDKTIQIISDSQCAIRRINSTTYEGNNELEAKFLHHIKTFIKNSKKKISFLLVKGHVHDGTKMSHYNNIADNIASDYRKIGIIKYNTIIKQRQSSLRI